MAEQQDREYQSGDFVWVQSKWEGPGPVVARVIRRAGSQYHVAWASCAGNLFDLYLDADELTPVLSPAEIHRDKHHAVTKAIDDFIAASKGEQVVQAGPAPMSEEAIPAAPPAESPAEAPPPAKPKRERKKPQ